VISEHDVQSAFGLTPSESRLAVRLASGLSLREAAQALGISYQTVRTKLKFVFQKTGVRRQAELILLLTRQAGDGAARGRPHRARRPRWPKKRVFPRENPTENAGTPEGEPSSLFGPKPDRQNR